MMVACPQCEKRTKTKQRPLGPPKLTQCSHCQYKFHPPLPGTPSPRRRTP